MPEQAASSNAARERADRLRGPVIVLMRMLSGAEEAGRMKRRALGPERTGSTTQERIGRKLTPDSGMNTVPGQYPSCLG